MSQHFVHRLTLISSAPIAQPEYPLYSSLQPHPARCSSPSWRASKEQLRSLSSQSSHSAHFSSSASRTANVPGRPEVLQAPLSDSSRESCVSYGLLRGKRDDVILRCLILPMLKPMPQSWQTRSLCSIAVCLCRDYVMRRSFGCAGCRDGCCRESP